MTVLDAQAVLAFLKHEPAAPEVARLLRGRSRLTSLGVGEVLDHLIRVAGVEEKEAALDVADLGLLLEALPVDAVLGNAAGRTRARRYHRRSCRVSLADCVAAEAARQLGEPLATSDPHLLEVCRSERIRTVVLPDSTGRRWTPSA